MAKRVIAYLLASVLTLLVTFVPWASAQGRWALGQNFVVTASKIPIYADPGSQKTISSYLYSGMTVEPTDWVTKEGVDWFKVGDRSLWVPASEPNGIINVAADENIPGAKIIDLYGILDQPHRYAVK